MPLTTIVSVMFMATFSQVTKALPISQNHRFAMYTPYWQQGPQHYTPPDFYPSHKRLGCDSEPCDELNNNLLHSQPYESEENLPLSKRNRNNYRKGWTMGGMPFSVLYMNPKPHMSVRSPASESLRSLPPGYDGALPPLQPAISSDVTDIQAEALQAPSPTMLPTRRQYSIIPQLFVSYGWRPLGK